MNKINSIFNYFRAFWNRSKRFYICFAQGTNIVAAFPSCPHLRSALVPLPPGGGLGLGAGGGTCNGRLHQILYLERSRRGTPPVGVGPRRGRAQRGTAYKGTAYEGICCIRLHKHNCFALSKSLLETSFLIIYAATVRQTKWSILSTAMLQVPPQDVQHGPGSC